MNTPSSGSASGELSVSAVGPDNTRPQKSGSSPAPVAEPGPFDATFRAAVQELGWTGLPKYAIAYAAAIRDVTALIDDHMDVHASTQPVGDGRTRPEAADVLRVHARVHRGRA